MHRPLARVIDLVGDDRQNLWSSTPAEARARLVAAEPTALLDLAGSFALVAREGETVRMARSLDRPLRYFLAKEVEGPMLVVAERISEIRDFLASCGYQNQFHPSYTRMVPAHHVTTLRLIGCPDPNPTYTRFFTPPRATGSTDLDALGAAYVGALATEIEAYLRTLPLDEPLGVCFSGGADSGAVLLLVEHLLRRLGQSPARLKAFTLAVEDEDGQTTGPDLDQARRFLRETDLEMLGEAIEVDSQAVDPWRAVAVIEDYKALDVECAAVALALAEGIRARYPEWRHLLDGDGGDENLKDYPIEENRELTLRSVVGNSMLYQEGWGVDAVKHSLTFSGGYSRGCVRTYAPLRRHGFVGFSPFTRPAVVAAAEAIPFDALCAGSHERLYALKGEILARGVRAVTGRTMPIFPKRRFQDGAVPAALRAERFAVNSAVYRHHFLACFT